MPADVLAVDQRELNASPPDDDLAAAPGFDAALLLLLKDGVEDVSEGLFWVTEPVAVGFCWTWTEV